MNTQKYDIERYPGIEDGDIYMNPLFKDMWIVDKGRFIKINDGYCIDITQPEGFVKIGHVDGLAFKKIENNYGDPSDPEWAVTVCAYGRLSVHAKTESDAIKTASKIPAYSVRWDDTYDNIEAHIVKT